MRSSSGSTAGRHKRANQQAWMAGAAGAAGAWCGLTRPSAAWARRDGGASCCAPSPLGVPAGEEPAAAAGGAGTQQPAGCSGCCWGCVRAGWMAAAGSRCAALSNDCALERALLAGQGSCVIVSWVEHSAAGLLYPSSVNNSTPSDSCPTHHTAGGRLTIRATTVPEGTRPNTN